MRLIFALLAAAALYAQPNQLPPASGGVGVGATNIMAQAAGPATSIAAINIASLNLTADTLNSLIVGCWTGTGFTGGKVTGDLTPLACSITSRSTSAVTVTFSNSSNVLVVINSNGGAGATGAAGAAGAAGANGNTILSGTSAPSGGANGDFYLKTDTTCMYGPKAAGAWPGTCTSLVGPQGTTGAAGAPGAAGSNGTNGTNGTNGAAGAGYLATSTTSLAIANGVAKAFTTQTGLAYSAGARARAASAADGTNFMEGLVSAYSGSTLTIQVDTIGGSGTKSDWNINVSGNGGATGAQGIQGVQGAAGSNGTAGTNGTGFTYRGVWGSKPGSPSAGDTMLFTDATVAGACPPTGGGTIPTYSMCTWNGSAFVIPTGAGAYSLPTATDAIKGGVTMSTPTSSVAVSNDDTRNADSRAPNGSASGSLAGSYPGPTLAYVATNPQTGASYAILTGDRQKLVTLTNGSAIAVSIAQAGSTGFPDGWETTVLNSGVGTATITPATSTIEGAATLVLTTGQSARITSNGTNYRAVKSRNALVSADIPANAANTSGNAATASALAANGANCTGTEFAKGVDASGAAEGCATPAGSSGIPACSTTPPSTGTLGQTCYDTAGALFTCPSATCSTSVDWAKIQVMTVGATLVLSGGELSHADAVTACNGVADCLYFSSADHFEHELNAAGTEIGINLDPTIAGYLSTLSSNAQSQLNAKAPLASPTFTGTVDSHGATKTLPHRTGTGSPSARDNCATVGETYFETDATAGSNSWACTTIGTPGTWTLQGSGGGSMVYPVAGVPVSISGTSWRGTAATAADVPFTQTGTGAVATTVDAKLKDSASIKDFGAIADLRTVTDGAMSSSTNPTHLSSATAAFTSADVGKIVAVAGAGTSGALLNGTINSISSGTVVVLSATCLTTVSGATAEIGTDNSTAFNSAFTAIKAAGGGRLYVPVGQYLYNSSNNYVDTTNFTQEASNVEVYGDGPGSVITFANGKGLFIGLGRNTVNGYCTTPPSTGCSAPAWGLPSYYLMNPVSSGNSITLVTAAQASNFSPGEAVFLESGNAAPCCGSAPAHAEWNTVVSANATTGVIVLANQLTDAYDNNTNSSVMTYNSTPTSGGSGFVAGDVGKVFTLACGANGIITSVGTGAVTGITTTTFSAIGSSCTAATGRTTTCASCNGGGGNSSLTVNVTVVGTYLAMISPQPIAPQNTYIHDLAVVMIGSTSAATPAIALQAGGSRNTLIERVNFKALASTVVNDESWGTEIRNSTFDGVDFDLGNYTQYFNFNHNTVRNTLNVIGSGGGREWTFDNNVIQAYSRGACCDAAIQVSGTPSAPMTGLRITRNQILLANQSVAQYAAGIWASYTNSPVIDDNRIYGDGVVSGNGQVGIEIGNIYSVETSPEVARNNMSSLYLSKGVDLYGGTVASGTRIFDNLFTLPGVGISIPASASGTVVGCNTFVGNSGTVSNSGTSTLYTCLLGSSAGVATSAAALTALTGMPAQAADTVVMNATAGSASPTAVSLTNCGDATHAASYNTSTHVWGCQAISGFLPIGGGTLTGNLLFTDNTLDIGATAATRPRTLYLGTSMRVQATSNQEVFGASTNLTTVTWPASSGAVTITGPNVTSTLQTTTGSMASMTGLTWSQLPPPALPTPGSTCSLSAPGGYCVCTTTCTVTLFAPVAAGDQVCVMNDVAVSTAITISGITSVYFSHADRSAYGASGGSFTATAAAGNAVCLVARDTTHWVVNSYNGTWTAN